MILTNDTGWAGLACPKCGCPRMSVYYTRPRRGGNLRVRTCDDCGRKTSTMELPLGAVATPVENPPKASAMLQEARKLVGNPVSTREKREKSTGGTARTSSTLRHYA